MVSLICFVINSLNFIIIKLLTLAFNAINSLYFKAFIKLIITTIKIVNTTMAS
jgi:hypothetical protein